MAELAKVILLYGGSGLGKTVACGDLAKNEACGGVFIQDLDGGLQSIKDKDGNLPAKVYASPFCGSRSDCEIQWNNAQTRKNIPADVQTYVIDSLTALEALMIAELQGHASSPWAAGEMNQQKWGKRRTQLTDYVRLARTLPYKYVILTAHQEVEREDGKIVKIAPSVGSEKMHETFTGFCSHVIQFSMTMGGQRQLVVNNNGNVMAKCRANARLAEFAPSGVCTKPLHEIIHML